MRRVLFWMHLTVGSVFGLVIGFIALTGMLLAFQRQILAAREGGISATPPYVGAQYLPVEELVRRAAAMGSGPPSQVVYSSRPRAPVIFQLDRFSVLYMDPYTGRSLGHGAVHCRAFFRTVEGLHRWFGAWGGMRAPARQVKGILALAFLVLIASGLVLWFPRFFAWRHFRAVLWFRSRNSGHARNWNWHHVAGIWCALPLLVMVLTGIVLQYDWANNLLYRAAGDTPPGPDHVFKPLGAARLLAGQAHWQPAVDRALQWQTGWTMITMNVPDAKGAPIVFTIDRANGGKPQDQAQLVLDQASGALVRCTPFSAKDRGEQLRELARWTHTGEAGGIFGEIIACAGACCAMLLVLTGLSLELDRLRSYTSRRNRERR